MAVLKNNRPGALLFLLVWVVVGAAWVFAESPYQWTVTSPTGTVYHFEGPTHIDVDILDVAGPWDFLLRVSYTHQGPNGHPYVAEYRLTLDVAIFRDGFESGDISQWTQ